MKYFKNSKKTPLKTPPPRSMDEINKDYSNLIGELGQAEFKLHLDQEKIKNLKYQLSQVNIEAHERQALDKQQKAEVVNEQI
jgi:hypothetical protein